MRSVSVDQPSMPAVLMQARSRARHRRRSPPAPRGLRMPDSTTCRLRPQWRETSGASMTSGPARMLAMIRSKGSAAAHPADGRRRGADELDAPASRWRRHCRVRPRPTARRCRRRRSRACGSARAAAMASTPEPQPRSRTRAKLPARVSRSMAIRQPQRRRVMRRAEGLAGLDQDGAGPVRDAASIVAAVHGEASGADGRQGPPARWPPS